MIPLAFTALTRKVKQREINPMEPKGALPFWKMETKFLRVLEFLAFHWSKEYRDFNFWGNVIAL